MSKPFKILLIVVVVLILAILAPPLFMPTKFNVNSSVVIKSNTYNVFPYIADLRNWEKWSSWKKKDPGTNFTYSSKSYGAGATLDWASKNPHVGTGKITIVQFKKFHHIKYRFEMKNPGNMTSSGQITLEKLNDTEVKVIWTDEGQLKYPFDRWVNCFVNFKAVVEKDFADGLSNLKSVVELNPQKLLPVLYPDTIQLEEQHLFSIMHETVLNKDLGAKIGESYHTILKTLESKKMEPVELPPICIFYKHTSLTSKIRPALFVNGCGGVQLDNGVECIPLYGDKVLRFTYVGGYTGMEPTYDAIDIYLDENKIVRKRDYTWESYVTDPGLEPDSNKWMTHIYVPIR